MLYSGLVTPTVSIIVPVKSWSREFDLCLAGLKRCASEVQEIIVVFDGSDAKSPPPDSRFRFVSVAHAGPAAARNFGASLADPRSELLLFIDSDVIPTPVAIRKLVSEMEADSGLGAAFGAYDAHPARRDFVSQYKNLMHRFFHVNGEAEAVTFWAGFGMVRRRQFLRVGGFDRAYLAPSVEDIDFGYRLSEIGARIRVVAEAQTKHLKQWNWRSMISTDVFQRAIPWSRLLLQKRRAENEALNYSLREQLRVVSACSIAPAAWLGSASLALVGFAVFAVLSWPLLRHFARLRGAWFAARAVFPQVLYAHCCAAAILIAAGESLLKPTVRSELGSLHCHTHGG